MQSMQSIILKTRLTVRLYQEMDILSWAITLIFKMFSPKFKGKFSVETPETRFVPLILIIAVVSETVGVNEKVLVIAKTIITYSIISDLNEGWRRPVDNLKFDNVEIDA